MLEFRVRFSDEQEVLVEVGASATFEEVAVKVRSFRHICAKQHLYGSISVAIVHPWAWSQLLEQQQGWLLLQVLHHQGLLAIVIVADAQTLYCGVVQHDHPAAATSRACACNCLHLPQVRSARGWDEQQNVRFICSGQEMYMQDSVSRACCSVLHCIASDTASRYSSARQAGCKSDAQEQAVDWVSAGSSRTQQHSGTKMKMQNWL
jgi:hypothetical protein